MEPRIITMPDGQPVDITNSTPEQIAKIRDAGLRMIERQSADAMSRNPREGGGPMPKIDFADPRIEAGPELARVAAKTGYDATLGQGVGIDRLTRLGLEKGVGLFSPGTENKMREAREFDAQNNPFTKVGHKVEEFIQPRSSQGTRAANVGSAALGGGLLGKAGTAFSPTMGAASGGLGAGVGELYGVASNPDKWRGDPANDEQFGKFGINVLTGGAAPIAGKFTQAMTGGALGKNIGKYDKIHLSDLMKEAGLTSADLRAIMDKGGILQKAQEQKIPLTTAQALARENPLDAAQALAQPRLELGATRQMLADQPGQALEAVRDVGAKSVLRHGNVDTQQNLANQGRASANGFFDRLGDEATGVKLAGIATNAGPGVPQDIAGDFLQQAQAYAAGHPGTRADRVVRSIEKAITNPEWAAAEKELAAAAKTQAGKGDKLLAQAGVATAAKNPHPQFLADEQQLRGALDSALAGFGRNSADSPAVTAELNKHAGYLRGLIADTIAPSTPGVNAGKRAAEGVLLESDKAKEQLIGALRGKTDTPAPLSSSLSNIFKDTARGPVQGTRGELFELRKGLEEGTAFGLDKAQQAGKAPVDLNPKLFADSARTWFDDIIERAGSGGGARPNTDAARILADEIGNKGKRLRMSEEIFQNVGDSLKIPSAITGMDREKLRDVMEVVGHTVERRGGGGLSQQQVLDKASPKELRTLGGFSVVAPLKFQARFLARGKEAASLKYLDKVLTTDQGRLDFARQMDLPKEFVSRAALTNILHEMSTQPRKIEEKKAALERKAKSE